MAFPQFLPSVYGRKYGTIYRERGSKRLIHFPFFLSNVSVQRSSKVIENKGTLNEIVGAMHVRFGFVCMMEM